MAEKLTKVQKLFQKYLTKMSALLESNDANELLDGLKSGDNQYLRIDRVGNSAFDDSWIKVIEDVMFDLGDIVANPRQNTRTTSDLVPVELARKTNSESIRHLASHTQFIKDITEGGDVIPSKILNIGNEDDIHTYENRFIATFIRKLVLFIEKRYEYIAKFAPLRDEEILMMKNRSKVGNSDIEIETKIKISSERPSDDETRDVAYLERIKTIRDYVLYFYNSPFMKKLKTDRDVRNPILQTNIIRKNLKYHHCYEVYLFIEKYSSLGVNYSIDENYSILNDKELDELNYAMLVNLLTAKSRYMSEIHKTISKTYKPKILTSYDDESFVYGPLYEGPIEFVRVDENYKAYLDKKVNNDLPAHPNKLEKEYYQSEIQLKKDTKEELLESDKLSKRKVKETERFNKLFDDFVKERQAEEERVRILVEDAVRELEEKRLEEIRQQMVQKAQEEFLPKQEQTPVFEEVKPVEETPAVVPSKVDQDGDEIIAENDNEQVTEPGKYILYTKRGYYVGVARYSKKKSGARVYTDLKKLNRIHLRQHGKIIKIG